MAGGSGDERHPWSSGAKALISEAVNAWAKARAYPTHHFSFDYRNLGASADTDSKALRNPPDNTLG
jgi:hypothetical protein